MFNVCLIVFKSEFTYMRICAYVALQAVMTLSFSFGQPAAKTPSLKEVRTIYIEPMPADLDQYIRAEITKQMKGRLSVVLKQEYADAIMTGVGAHDKGVTNRITGRYLGLHDTATGSISVIDKEGKMVLWSSEAGDRSIWWGALKRGGPRKVADRLVHNLKRAMR